MAIVETDWSITRSSGNIRYIGDDHGGASPSYATVIEFHRWLQDKADDALASGDDELDITNTLPSQRSTDNIITLINSYNIDDAASEHLYDGSIIQNGGDDIYDGFVNFGNSDVQVQIIQDGAVLTDDWWNFSGGGLNPSSAQGISHRFMLPTRVSGTDTDGRRILGTCRRFGYTYAEFPVNGTARGNNVLALSDATDLNNATVEGTVSGWTTITNTTEGYIGLDVNDDGTPEYYYSQWNRDSYSINQFYERMKWLTRDGSGSTLYGLDGELFRGITHEVAYSSLTGTFDEGNEISWSGASVGTGQVLADNGADKLWLQLLTGVAPVSTASLSQISPDAASATAGTITDRSATITTPFVGQSTGSALIGGYGVGMELSDLDAADKVFDLTNTQYSRPVLITNTVTGVVSGEDRIIVAPWDGVTNDVNGDPAIEKDQLSLNTSLTTDYAVDFDVVVTTAIPADTPATGTIRVVNDSGFEKRLVYDGWTGSTFSIDFSASEADIANVCDFAGVDEEDSATAGVDVYISYIDEIASGTSASFQVTYSADRDLVVVVRDGGGTPIKQFISSWSISNSNQSIAVIRTTDV